MWQHDELVNDEQCDKTATENCDSEQSHSPVSSRVRGVVHQQVCGGDENKGCGYWVEEQARQQRRKSLQRETRGSSPGKSIRKKIALGGLEQSLRCQQRQQDRWSPHRVHGRPDRLELHGRQREQGDRQARVQPGRRPSQRDDVQVISGKRGGGQNSDQPPQPKIIYSVDCEKLQVFRYRREVAADGQQYARFRVPVATGMGVISPRIEVVMVAVGEKKRRYQRKNYRSQDASIYDGSSINPEVPHRGCVGRPLFSRSVARHKLGARMKVQ